ncbi:hypothetical protein GCM10027405_21410 [Arthrobacter alkaliphilus]|uniref:hypothetical protein n=1 Tax=Arthrobacter alkaliphilus TaxID=369936 RepID=UPI001F45DD0C|nr:hypothetical protein [Arthrobacter alkaliphilus]
MKFYSIEPAVDGSSGELTEYEPGHEGRRLESFHMVLDAWLGDDLVTRTPGFAVSRNLANRLAGSGLSGFELRDMYVSISVEGTESLRRNNTPIPDLVWLYLTGEPGVSDFAEDRDLLLVISEAALTVLHEFDIKRAAIEQYGA